MCCLRVSRRLAHLDQDGYPDCLGRGLKKKKFVDVAAAAGYLYVNDAAQEEIHPVF